MNSPAHHRKDMKMKKALPSKAKPELIRIVEKELARVYEPTEAVRFLLEQFSGWDLDAIMATLVGRSPKVKRIRRKKDGNDVPRNNEPSA